MCISWIVLNVLCLYFPTVHIHSFGLLSYIGIPLMKESALEHFCKLQFCSPVLSSHIHLNGAAFRPLFLQFLSEQIALCCTWMFKPQYIVLFRTKNSTDTYFLDANHFVSDIQRELGGSERSDRKQKLGAPKPRSVNTLPSGQHPRVNWRLASAIRIVLCLLTKNIQFDYKANQATSQPQSKKLAPG